MLTRELYILTLVFVLCVNCDKTNNNILPGRLTYSERLNRFTQDSNRDRPTGSRIPHLHDGYEFFRDTGVPESLHATAEESLCYNHTIRTIEALATGASWALKVYDVVGKQPAGMYEHPSFDWLGDYDECMGIEPVAYTDAVNKTGAYTPFMPRYCSVYFDAKSLDPSIQTPLILTVGFCLPESCNNSESTAVAREMAKTSLPSPWNLLPVLASNCQERELQLSDKAKAVIAVCAVFAALIVLGTVYDVIIVLFLTPSDDLDDYEIEKSGKRGYGAIGNGVSNTETLAKNPLYDAGDRTPLLDDLTQSGSQANATSHHKHDVGRLRDDVNATKKMPPSKYKPGLLGRLCLSFSIYTNAAKLLNTSQPPGVLTSVNGIRFITMTWVILGHTFVFGDRMAKNWNQYFVVIVKRFTYQVIANETVAVDTFFVLSGLLVAYLTLKGIKKKTGPLKFNWFLFVFHRFWRLTPPYMLVLMLYVPLFQYWADGPKWSQTGVEVDECRDTWWRNLLYINNLYDTDKMCMGWSWYLANDMQFYLISPFIVVPFFYSGLAGSVLCFLLVLGNLITAGLISKHYNFSASVKLDPPAATGDSFAKLYVKPWTRVAPYAIGLLAGYLLYKTQSTVRVPKGHVRVLPKLTYRRLYQLINILGWAIAATFALLALYGPYTSDGRYAMTEGETHFYNAAFRTGWGLAVAWVVLACATGYGGPVTALLSWRALIPLSRLTYVAYLAHPVVMVVYYMSHRVPRMCCYLVHPVFMDVYYMTQRVVSDRPVNALLSWRALIPLSRLTYVAYLVHPVVMDVYYESQRELIYWYDLEIIYEFLGHLCMSYGVAFVISLAFESPMMGLEKVLLGRDKQS